MLSFPQIAARTVLTTRAQPAHRESPTHGDNP
ncbi:hypothetical protein FrEUN1fDRAFT_3392 [Parafrankia sp. EUN1f]|nr:hypothetical protein FrEUN1fDRAFT_3392 [Parafrankia sp. EUN1f]